MGPPEPPEASPTGPPSPGDARLGLSAPDHLVRNDSNPYLLATGDLLVTGPTGTNVGDLMVVWNSSST